MPLEFAGSYANKFSSGGRIHEDNGGLPMPSSFQVKSHTSRGANSMAQCLLHVTFLPLHRQQLFDADVNRQCWHRVTQIHIKRAWTRHVNMVNMAVACKVEAVTVFITPMYLCLLKGLY